MSKNVLIGQNQIVQILETNCANLINFVAPHYLSNKCQEVQDTGRGLPLGVFFLALSSR